MRPGSATFGHDRDAVRRQACYSKGKEQAEDEHGSRAVMSSAEQPKDAEQRRREVIARVVSSQRLMAQHRASRAAREKGERGIPFARIRAEAEARRRRA
jgi:hypothetical protein